MNMRLSRVEETLRRALAEILLRGELRDPRLRNAAAISITAVKISPDLGQAQVYVDVLGDPAALQSVIEGLNAGAAALRARLGGRIRLKRTPTLRFVADRSIEQGRRIEAVLAELHAHEGGAQAPASEPAPTGEAASPADDDHDDDDHDDGDRDDDLDADDEPTSDRRR
jgi:ribosome-binding factor A